ncbi:hypothetical protein ACXPWS_15355 [Mycobacterium sp. BMJ-28]
MARQRWLWWVIAGVAAAVVAGAIAVPTALVPNSFYGRMTAPPWRDYPVWALTAVLTGVLIASYVRRPALSHSPAKAGIIGTLGSALAVGCPLCNKVVVAAVGFSGALNVWAPVQPVLAVVSLVVLSWALWQRRVALRGCRVPEGGPVGVSVPETAG